MKINHNGPLMQGKSLFKEYEQGGKKIEVLKGVSLELHQGGTYAITGASGSGKSTLLHILSGLDQPTAGEVWFQDQHLHRLGRRAVERFRQTSIGFMFQFHYLIQELTVIENCLLPARVAGLALPEATTRAHELLQSVGLADKAYRYPSQLSGGEQQRVSLARALIHRPSILCADEPTGNLDADNAQRIVEILLAAQQQWQMTVVLCSHDEAVYGAMQQIYHLEQGLLHNV